MTLGDFSPLPTAEGRCFLITREFGVGAANHYQLLFWLVGYTIVKLYRHMYQVSSTICNPKSSNQGYHRHNVLLFH